MKERICITEYGAVSGKNTVNTLAIQAAIDACPENGCVVIPEGVFCSGALFLKSNMTLYLEPGACLLGSINTEDYPLMTYRWEGRETLCYASLLNTKEGKQENIRIQGSGTIDANGMVLFQKEMAEKKGARGRAVCLRNVDGIQISGVTIRQSPAWCLHLIYCDNILIEQVEIHTKYSETGDLYRDIFNGDGIDIDSCRNVVMRDSLIASQDDCIAIKSGRDEEGRNVGLPTENVTITNCIFRYGFGVAMGSEMSGGIKNVIVTDCRFEDTYSFASVKAPRGRGGVIEDITYKNIEHYNHSLEHRDCRWFRGCLYIDQFYGEEIFDAGRKATVTDGTATIRNILFENVKTETVAGNGIYLCGLPEQPLEQIRLKNVKVSALHGIYVRNVVGLEMEEVVQSVQC